MGRYASDQFFHLVGRRDPRDNEANYQRLKTILEAGCVSHPPHIPGPGETGYRIDWSKNLFSELLVPSVVCFCDIPEESLAIHLGKYGRFGLSFARDHLIFQGARPVIYIPFSGTWPSLGFDIVRDIEAAYRGFKTHLYEKTKGIRDKPRSLGALPSSPEEAIRAIGTTLELYFLAFLKPFDARLPEDHISNFYMEREWRKYGNLEFKPADVKTLVVAPGYETRLVAEMPGYAKTKMVALK